MVADLTPIAASRLPTPFFATPFSRRQPSGAAYWPISFMPPSSLLSYVAMLLLLPRAIAALRVDTR